MSQPPPPPPGGPQPPYGPPPPQGPQPPYGAPPPGQPYPGQPYQPYGQPSPYQPPKSGNKTVWIILGVIGVLILMFCGGCFAVGALITDRAADEVEDLADATDPEPVDEGAAFEKDDVEAEEGWSVADQNGYFTITDLTVTNHDETFGEARTIALYFTIFDGDTAIAEIYCTSPSPLEADEKAELECGSGDQFREFDGIKVYSTSF